MLLPKGGLQWKAARARLPHTKAMISLITKPRSLLIVTLVGITLLLWRGISSSASDMQR